MTGASRRRPGLRHVWLFALVGVSYVVGSEAAFRFASHLDLDAAVFLPAGVTLAALLRTRTSEWWVVVVAAAVAELVQDLRAGLTAVESVGFVVANVVEPLVAAVAITRVVRDRVDLTRTRDVRAFVAFGVVLGPAIGAAIGAVTDRSLGGGEFLRTLWQWWFGDALGVLLVAGAILAWGSSPDRRPLTSWSGAALVVGSATLTAVVLSWSDLPLMFMVLTGVVVAGAQFGVRAVAWTAAVSAVAAAVVFWAQSGDVIVGVSTSTGLLIVKLKYLVFTTGGLIVAAEVFERDLITIERTRLESTAAAEHRTVERLQHLLLPAEHITAPRFVAHGRYVAASTGLGIGGDWYDVVELPDDRTFVSVGDVVGHGAEAAATMSRLKVAISVLASTVDDPARLLDKVDEVATTIPNARCTTTWVGYFDHARSALTYASAGHPPGFVVDDLGVRRLTGAVNPPLLVPQDGPRLAVTIHTVGPTRLFLYTDGLVERRRQPIATGIDRLERVLHLAARSGRVALDDLDHLRHGASDDTVLLLVELTPRRDPASADGGISIADEVRATVVPRDARSPRPTPA